MNRGGAETIPDGTADGTRRNMLSRFARGASIETSARSADDLSSYPHWLSPGTRVYVAWIPGSTPGHCVELSLRLKELGLRPVPHIAAREIESMAAAQRLIARLGREAGIDEALLIAGDRAQAKGPYAGAEALLRTGLFEDNGIKSLGFAGYPEGHPRIGADGLDQALSSKLGYAAAQGIEPFIVTQFCFDGAIILDWLRTLRKRGVSAPVWIGMAGPARVGTLIKYGMRCGIGNSLRALSAHARQVTQLVASQGPESVAAPVAWADPALGIAGWHLFAFGGFARTAEWIRIVAEGKVQWEKGGGFRVLES